MTGIPLTQTETCMMYQKQKKMLHNFCCNKAQGYYYAKPMKAQDYMPQRLPLTGGPVADRIRNKSKKNKAP